MFRLLVTALGLTLKVCAALAALMDQGFKRRLRQRDLSVVIRTMDGRHAVTYLLRGGRISTAGGDHADPDFCIAWSSAGAAYRTLAHLVPERMVKSLIGAFRDGRLKIEFKLEPFMWFLQTATQMLGVFCDRTKPKRFLFINRDEPRWG